MRIWFFRAVILLLGPAILGAIELLLLLFSVLGPPPLVLDLAERHDQQIRMVNPNYPRQFFTQRYQGRLIASGQMAPRPFLEPTLAPLCRIVVVGASTVQGFPHPRRLAAASFLEAMLQDALPGHQVQVFNLGITSIGSVAVAQVLADALVLQPDAVVVYTGHNEFYGLYGAGGNGPRSFDWLQYNTLQWRTGRLLNEVVDALRGRVTVSQSLLEIMSQRGHVPLDSSRRRSAKEDLAANLRQMVELCRRRDTPLILCTLVSNDAGFAPVASVESPLKGARTDYDRAWVDSAEILLNQDAIASESAGRVLSLLARVKGDWDDSAWFWYLRGCALDRLGMTVEARRAFRLSRSLDTMPWRAPSSHNEVIRALAGEDGVLVADIEEDFLRASPSRGIGWELMADYVHPSVRGQALMARAILDKLEIILVEKSPQLKKVRRDEAYQAMLGDLPIERVVLQRTIAKLLASPPMDRYNGHNARFFRQRARAEWQQLSAPERLVAEKWLEHQGDMPLVLDAAEQLFAARDFSQARLHYAASRRNAPFTLRADLWAAVQWAWTMRLEKRALAPADREQLRQALDRADLLAEGRGPELSPPILNYIRGELHYFLAEYEEALPFLEAVYNRDDFRSELADTLFPALAAALVHAGRAEEAGRLTRKEKITPRR